MSGYISIINPTLHRKAGLLPPKERFCIDPPALLHAAPDHDGVPVDCIDDVDRVGDGVVELAHVLGTADLLCLVITDVPAHKAANKDNVAKYFALPPLA